LDYLLNIIFSQFLQISLIFGDPDNYTLNTNIIKKKIDLLLLCQNMPVIKLLVHHLRIPIKILLFDAMVVVMLIIIIVFFFIIFFVELLIVFIVGACSLPSSVTIVYNPSTTKIGVEHHSTTWHTTIISLRFFDAKLLFNYSGCLNWTLLLDLSSIFLELSLLLYACSL
jgi:hypothetical protein